MPRREIGYNLEITRPNDKKTEKKFKLGRWRPVLLEEENALWRYRRRRRGIGEQNRSDENAGGKERRQSVKIRALRERLIKGCKLTGANDVT